MLKVIFQFFLHLKKIMPFFRGSTRVQKQVFFRPSSEIVSHNSQNKLLALLFKGFIANHISVHTRRAYQKDFQEFLEYLHIHKHLELPTVSDLSIELMVDYRNYLQHDRKPLLNTASINRQLAVLKSFVKYLHQMGYNEIPSSLIKTFPQNSYSKTQAFSDEQVVKLLSAVPRHQAVGSMHYALLLVLFHLGLRRSECAQLKFSDIGVDRGVKSIQILGKGGRLRKLPLTKHVEDAINQYCQINKREPKANEPIFCSVKNHTINPLSTTQIYLIIKKYQKRAGISGSFSPHSARATAISNAIDHNAHVSQIQYFAGWTSPAMMTRYDKRRSLIENSAVYKIDFESKSKKTSAEET